MTDPWQYWKDALAGKQPQMNESNPQPGFYRWPQKSGYGARRTFKPVAYWQGTNGVIECHVGFADDKSGVKSPTYGADIWPSVGSHPVTEAAYRAVAEQHEPWPDEHELVPMDRSNQAPADDSFEGLRDAIEPLAIEAKRLLDAKAVAKTQDEADRIANLADRLSELWKKADDARKEERRPLADQMQQVQDKWLPIVTGADQFKNLKYALLTPFLADQKRIADEAMKASQGDLLPPPEPPRPRAGTRGRAMTMRSVKSARVLDYGKVYEFFAKNSELQFLLQDLANKAVRAGVEVPGTEIYTESKAV